jgi:hypothetical protein
MKNTYKPKEFAAMLGVTVKTLQRWDNDDKLKAYRNPKNRRYYKREQYEKLKRESNDHFLENTNPRKKGGGSATEGSNIAKNILRVQRTLECMDLCMFLVAGKAVSATIGEILDKLGLLDDEPMQKEASHSIEQNLSDLFDEVFGMTKTANTLPTKTPAEEAAANQQFSPQQVAVPEQVAVAPETATEAAKEALKADIIQAGASLVEDAMNELLEQQQVKVAAVQKLFGENSSKGLLFAKLATDSMIMTGRIVRDYDFSSHQGGNPDLSEWLEIVEGEPTNTL